MEDWLYEKIKDSVRSSGELSQFDYFKAVKQLSDSFGLDPNVAEELNEYWYSKDVSKLSDDASNALLDFVYYFALVAKKPKKEDEDDGQQTE